MTTTVTPTGHEKAEWGRMAQAAYRVGSTALGHALSAAAALPTDAPITVDRFDALMMDYRRWLLDGRIP